MKVLSYIYSTHQHARLPRCQHLILLPCTMCQIKEKEQKLVLFLGRSVFHRKERAVPFHAHNLCEGAA